MSVLRACEHGVVDILSYASTCACGQFSMSFFVLSTSMTTTFGMHTNMKHWTIMHCWIGVQVEWSEQSAESPTYMWLAGLPSVLTLPTPSLAMIWLSFLPHLPLSISAGNPCLCSIGLCEDACSGWGKKEHQDGMDWPAALL